jgi:hypothetical protein
MASSAAKFAVVLDFPVPPRNEWTETILDIFLLHENKLKRVATKQPDACNIDIIAQN